MRRLLALTAIVSIVSLPGAPASAASGCAFDAGTAIATVTVADGAVTVGASSNAIVVDGVACGAATTSSTDQIAITTTGAGDVVTIDLAAQRLAPGKTNEGDSSSEIEVDIAGTSFSLVIIGQPTADRIALGVNGAQGLANLNDNEQGWDADVSFDNADLLGAQIQLGAGADWYAASLNAEGAIEPITDRTVTVLGGESADRMQAHASTVFDGGAGKDMLTLDWLGAGCSANVINGLPTDVDSTVSGCTDAANGSFQVANAETLFGTTGDDTLMGATWSEELWGLGGDDTLVPSLGNDVNNGGPGTDHLVAESSNGRRFTFDLTAKTLVGQGTDTFAGVELLSSTSEGADTFVGDPGRGIRFVSGGGGLNVLDLSDGTRAVQVRTQAGADPAGIERGWILAQGVIVIGTPFDDRMIGMPGAFVNDHDEFRGMGGNDLLEGAAGADTLLGGVGDDQLIGGSGIDMCVGGPGADTLKSCEG